MYCGVFLFFWRGYFKLKIHLVITEEFMVPANVCLFMTYSQHWMFPMMSLTFRFVIYIQPQQWLLPTTEVGSLKPPSVAGDHIVACVITQTRGNSSIIRIRRWKKKKNPMAAGTKTWDKQATAAPAQRCETNLASSSNRALHCFSHRPRGGVAGRLGATLIHNREAFLKSAGDAIQIKRVNKGKHGGTAGLDFHDKKVFLFGI